MSKNKIVALQNILKKEEFIIKKDSINLNMLTKKKLNDFKKNPESYLNNLSCDELIELIQHFNYSYYIEGISLVGDELYDYVKDSLKKKHPTHPLLNDVGVTVSSKRKLPYYMGSMDKIKNDEKFLNKWIKKYPNDNKYIISDKLEIKSVGSELIFRCQGQFANAEIRRTESDGNMEFIKKDENKIIQGEFSLKNLGYFIKCTNLCNQIEMYLENDMPLVVKYNVASLGEIKLCLATLPST